MDRSTNKDHLEVDDTPNFGHNGSAETQCICGSVVPSQKAASAKTSDAERGTCRLPETAMQGVFSYSFRMTHQ
jgi:hypothetical protein